MNHHTIKLKEDHNMIVQHPHDPASDWMAPSPPRCSLCNGLKSYPHVQFHSERDIVICAECCEACGKGLILDIIHCNAISEVRRIAGEDITLERTTVSRIVAREKEEAIEKLKREALEDERIESENCSSRDTSESNSP